MRYQEQHQHQPETCSLDVNAKPCQAPTQTLASEEEGGGNTRGRNAFEPPADSAACFLKEPLPTAPTPLRTARVTGTPLFSASTWLLGLNNFNRRTNKGARVTKKTISRAASQKNLQVLVFHSLLPTKKATLIKNWLLKENIVLAIMK